MMKEERRKEEVGESESKKEKESGPHQFNRAFFFSPDLDLDLDLDLRSSLFFFSRARAAAEITQR